MIFSILAGSLLKHFLKVIELRMSVDKIIEACAFHFLFVFDAGGAQQIVPIIKIGIFDDEFIVHYLKDRNISLADQIFQAVLNFFEVSGVVIFEHSIPPSAAFLPQKID
jgi:hypothetical protein